MMENLKKNLCCYSAAYCTDSCCCSKSFLKHRDSTATHGHGLQKNVQKNFLLTSRTPALSLLLCVPESLNITAPVLLPRCCHFTSVSENSSSMSHSEQQTLLGERGGTALCSSSIQCVRVHQKSDTSHTTHTSPLTRSQTELLRYYCCFTRSDSVSTEI